MASISDRCNRKDIAAYVILGENTVRFFSRYDFLRLRSGQALQKNDITNSSAVILSEALHRMVFGAK